MGAADVEKVLRAPGQLCINPTDLTIVFPHGGTSLGALEAALVQPFKLTEEIISPSRNDVAEWLYLGESWKLSAILRQQDDDVKTTLFENTSVGAVTGERVVNARGTVLPGSPLSARAVQLCFSPFNPTHPGVLFHRALPALEETAELNFSMFTDLSFAALFVAIPSGTNGRPADYGRLADLDALL